jgi:Ubiquitin-activating enzyme E1 FCCH domain
VSVPRLNQSSFSGGILSPGLHRRVDLAKYQTGLKDGLNVTLHAHGGVSNRAGLQFIAETKGSAVCRKIPFDFDAETDQTYQLVFTPGRMRVLRQGVPVLETAKAITGISTVNPAVVTSVAHGYSNGDEIIIIGVVGMTALNGRNFIVSGVTANTFTLLDMFGVPVNSTAMTAYVSGGSARRIYEIATPYADSDLPDIDYVQENDVLFLAHVNHEPRKLSRLADDNWMLGLLVTVPQISAPTGVSGTAYFLAVSGSSANIGYAVSAVGPGGAQSAVTASVSVLVQYSQNDGRVVRLSWNPVVGASFYNVYRTDSSTGILVTSSEAEVEIPQTQINGDGTAVPGSSAVGAPAVPTGLVGAALKGREIKYSVSSISATTGEESLPSAPFTLRNDLNFATNRNLITWSAVAGADSYIIYKQDNGRYGYVGQSETTSFTDRNTVADLAQGPQESDTPFDLVNRYPNCLTFIEQRLGFAGTKENPSGVFIGQSSNYENFGSASPATAKDSITFRIRSRQKNFIRAMVPIANGLAIFTSAAEWIISGGSEDFLTPSNVVIKPQSYRGSSNVKPLLVGSTVLFMQSRGFVIRDFNYEFANDNFTGSDLTVLSRHLFKGKMGVAWAYAQTPDSVVWVVCDDGSVLSLTYMREHEVWGWSRHDLSGGFAEGVSVVAERERDAIYFTVRRTVNGQTKRYIERLSDRVFETSTDCFFVDSGLSYMGSPVSIISGLWHLEGQTVVALADGNVVRNLMVANGSVTLPNAASTIHVGLAYEAYIQTLDIDLGALGGMGSVQGRTKAVGDFHIGLEDSRGLWIGTKQSRLTEWRQRETESYNEAIRLFTGIVQITPHSDWDRSGSMIIKQRDPLPMTILSVMPEIKVGG